jgi:hypothetical protein
MEWPVKEYEYTPQYTPTEIAQWQAEGYYYSPVWREKSRKENI